MAKLINDPPMNEWACMNNIGKSKNGFLIHTASSDNHPLADRKREFLG
jgi:hypothetical protein